MIFESLLDEYLSFLRQARGVCASSVLRNGRIVRRLLASLEKRERFDIRALRPQELDAFLRSQGRKLARRSMADVASVLRSFLRYLGLRGILPGSMVDAVVGPKMYAQESLPRCLSPEEVGSLLAAIDTRTPIGRRDYALFCLMLSTGLRPGEAVRVRLDDIDWKERLVHIRQTKTGRPRTVPFSPEAGAALLRYLQLDRCRDASPPELFLGVRRARGRPLDHPDVIYLRFRRYARLAGLRADATPYSLRHTFAQNLLEGGADFTTLQNLLGHVSTGSVLIYAKVSLSALREVAQNDAEEM